MKHCSHRSRETPSTIRDLGDAIGPWDVDVGVDEYDSDDSFIAPEDNDEEDTETRLDSAGKENDAISSTQVSQRHDIFCNVVGGTMIGYSSLCIGSFNFRR